MRTAIGILWVLVLSGCGFNRAKFDEEFTAAYCEVVLACGDEAVLTFDGIESIADCTAQVAPSVTTLGGGECKFKARKAKKCVKALGSVSCDEEGGFTLPAECDLVFKKGECSADPAEQDPVLGDTDTDAVQMTAELELAGQPPVSYINLVQGLGSR